ncbi:MAG: hypothetical protein ACREM6_15535 [Vulcanimicrobiaceae bacterium]
MLAQTLAFEVVANGSPVTLNYLAPNGTAAVHFRLIVAGGANALSPGVSFAHSCAPVNADGSAGTYVASNMPTRTLAPVANAYVEDDVLVILSNDPYRVDPVNNKWRQLTITNLDTTAGHVATIAVFVENESSYREESGGTRARGAVHRTG